MNIVKNKPELISALASAGGGETVYVKDNARIDLSGERLEIPGGVTLASKSGLLFSRDLDTRPLLSTSGPNVCINGLRIKGPDPDINQENTELPHSEGIHANHANLIVRNCEVWGWSFAGIFIDAGAVDAYIHHNNIHHCQRWGLGYGIWVEMEHPLIEANDFDWGRHAIAGSGVIGVGYEIRFNTFGKNFYHTVIDMHDGGASGRPDPGVAGGRLLIHHNLILTTDEFSVATHIGKIGIMGVPDDLADVYSNRFAVELQEDAISQRIDGVDRYDDFRRISVHDNEYGFQSASKWHSA